MEKNFSNSRILVTGCSGTIGAELMRNLARLGVARLVGVDIDQARLEQQQNELAAAPDLQVRYGDVRDYENMHEVMNNIDLVFHTAALKHIPFCEQAPLEAVQSNIVGVKNVIAAATARKVLRVLFTSSDKGVNPASVMGATKLVGERLISSSHDRDDHQTVFFSTRFGNVLGSSGSVVPVFHQQIAAGGPVTLTDPRMTRFAMTVSQAAELLLSSADQATGGEVFITKMPVIRIKDLAEVMIDALAPVYGHKARSVELEITGIRPGEKLSEELMSTEEVARACELEKYFVVLPDSQPDDSHLAGAAVSKAYTVQAQAPLEKSQLLQFLRDGGLLEPMP